MFKEAPYKGEFDEWLGRIVCYAGATPLAMAGAASKQLAGSASWIKANVNPDQPRVPAGNPDGGQWINSGGNSEPSLPASQSKWCIHQMQATFGRAVVSRLAQRAISHPQPMKPDSTCRMHQLDQLSRDQTALANQANMAKVRVIDEEGSLRFSLPASVTPAGGITERVPVTASFEDRDGMPIYLLLHVVDGKLWELEIYKADGSQILNPPTADKLRF